MIVNKTLIKWVMLVVACIILPSTVVLCQNAATNQTEEPAAANAEPPGPGPDAGVPFDGGVSLLVAAGVAYGAKKRYDAKQKNIAPNKPEEAGI